VDKRTSRGKVDCSRADAIGEVATDAEKLLAIEEIKRLMARRIRSMDTKDWVDTTRATRPMRRWNRSHVTRRNTGPRARSRGARRRFST